MLYSKRKEMPFFSVVIPTFNSEKHIAKTLETVFLQTYNNYEVVVSDDGSSDNTKEIVKAVFNKFPHKRVRLLINRHVGPGAARNGGIKAATGEWVSFLDSDDQWFHQKLQNVADYIYHNEGIDLVCHSEIWQNGNKEMLLKYSNAFNKEINPFLSLYRQNALSTSAVTVRKKLLINVGLFDTALTAAQDYDLWLRLALIPKIKIEFIEEPLGVYVIRDGNISSNIEQRLCCILKINNKYFKNIKQVSKFPNMDKLRFEGRAYGSAGLGLIRKKILKKGIIYFVIGMLKWPFRFDWVYKLRKRIYLHIQLI